MTGGRGITAVTSITPWHTPLGWPIFNGPAMTDPQARLATALADRYTIQRELGAGGMATVYLAQDLKHDRKVAVKVLRPDLAAALGPERFLREVKIAANLQHPHVLPLYDSGQADGFLYYVMPFVDGVSLREKLVKEGELPIPDAVRILRDVADAMAYAHSQGVVHRDIKPENIMLSGRHALVTDFGVAKAVSEATGRQTLTTAGVALGTPTYMSPEQAAADPQTDHRADLYAFGVVAYELLAGLPPFVGATPQAVLAAHVTIPAQPVTNHRASIPPALAALVMRCLEKKPADRWQHAEELIPQLEAVLTPSGGMTPTSTMPVAAVTARRPSKALIGAVALAVTVVAGLVLVLARRDPETVVLGRQTQVTHEGGLEVNPTISPDHRIVAFQALVNGRWGIYARALNGGRTILLTDTSDASEGRPLWSPDGTRVLFSRGPALYTVPAPNGGMSTLLMRASGTIESAAWSRRGDSVAFISGDTLYKVGANGGAPVPVGAVRPQPQMLSWSPDGAWFGYVSGAASMSNTDPSEIWIVPAAGGASVLVASRQDHVNLSPVFSPEGRALFFVSDRDGRRDIFTIRLSARGQPTGPPVRLTTGLDVFSISLSADGQALAYSVSARRANLWAVAIPARGEAQLADAVPLTSGRQAIEDMSVSPDGRWLLFDSDQSGNADLYRIPIGGGEPERLTTDVADEFVPRLSPDGREIAFLMPAPNLGYQVFVRPIEGGPRTLVAPGSPPNWSPDGRRLSYQSGDTLFVSERRADGTWGPPRMVARLVSLHGSDYVHEWSPDGHFLVICSGDTVAVVAVDGSSRRMLYLPRDTLRDPVPTAPVWSRDGQTVYFRSPDRSIWAVPVTGGSIRLAMRFGDPARPSIRDRFDTDGKRFYFTVEEQQSDIWVTDVTVGKH